MGRRPSSPTKDHAELTLTQLNQGIDRLTKVISRLQQFEPKSVTEQYDNPSIDQLAAAIDDALVRTFGQNTLDYDRYRPAAEFDNGPHNYAFKVPIQDVQKSLTKSKGRNLALLEQAVESLKERVAEKQAVAEPDPSNASVAARASNVPSSKVFLVHGRDNAVKNEVALFLRKIGLEDIILHEQPNGGRHLLTKFRDEADGAGFAVVLMTPDDEGGLAGGTPHARARQNVVFELGFFIGKLGPANVAALIKGDLERPSDFDGIGYIRLDATGNWKTELARELRHANIPFDPNKLLSA